MKFDNVGWHTFRHTSRSWLDDSGAPIGVQQKLMRHADIATTGRYGDALMESKRKHNSIVVRRALGFAGLWGMSNPEGTAARGRHPKGFENPKS